MSCNGFYRIVYFFQYRFIQRKVNIDFIKFFRAFSYDKVCLCKVILESVKKQIFSANSVSAAFCLPIPSLPKFFVPHKEVIIPIKEYTNE